MHLSNTFASVEQGWNAVYIEAHAPRCNDPLNTVMKFPKIAGARVCDSPWFPRRLFQPALRQAASCILEPLLPLARKVQSLMG